MSQQTKSTTANAESRSTKVKTVHLALQGGGAHGAFTWGVLDRLLDDPGIEIGRISGTSAGALNGAALVTGYATGGRDGAKRNLALLWQNAWKAGSSMAMLQLPIRKPGLGVWDELIPLASPYQTAPLALEPLRYLVSSIADFSVCKGGSGPQLYVNAVNINTCTTRVFGPHEQSVTTIMASACAPFMFPAVMIDGDAYWDGSYGGNPSLTPLYGDQSDADILMVELTPKARAEVPLTAKNILNRMNELASMNGLRTELREIERLNMEKRGKLRMHIISLIAGAADVDAEPSSKRTVGPLLFESLRAKGRAACEQWLDLHRARLGSEASVDVASTYLMD